MTEAEKPLILCVDDESVVLKLMERLLRKKGFNVLSNLGCPRAIALIHKNKPDLILMDVKMSQMSGFEICSHLQENDEVSMIPVIFVSGSGGETDRAKAFSLGAVDFLQKPFDADVLVDKVLKTLRASRRWKALASPKVTGNEKAGADFDKFRSFLGKKLSSPSDVLANLPSLSPMNPYGICSASGLKPAELAQLMAEFLDMDYLSHIDPESIRLGILPTSFCKANGVVPIGGLLHKFAFALSNPFDWTVQESLQRFAEQECSYRFIAEPSTIASLFSPDSLFAVSPGKQAPGMPADGHSTVRVCDDLLSRAVTHHASDIHIEPKEVRTVVRFRIDGEMREMFTVPKQMGTMLVSRLKALGGLDISEKRKPQDGSVEVKVNGKTMKLRLATTGTANGESMIIRLLDPDTRPTDFRMLGMTTDQAGKLADFAARSQGLLLVVGPTGAGKTTTLYSLLSQVDGRTRSLISVEDPVEYRIPAANQQQVNEKAGVTFESLLKSSVRQDPDILFIGEVRDPYSAKVALDFSSTGHLTLSTLHTSNATTAIFRLERLGVERSAMADTILGIIAQRLLKKLCVHCRKIEPATSEERELLESFSDDTPSKVAHAVGCQQCDYTGYSGREGVYEILEFDTSIRDMVRAHTSIAEIRVAHERKGGYLISHHALQKVREFIITPKDAYENVLVEETRRLPGRPELEAKPLAPLQQPEATMTANILCVEDDSDAQALMDALLRNQGYNVTLAADGIEALRHLDKTKYDLIISDLKMPHLDGFKLLEMINQRGINTPVLFLSADTSPEAETKGLGIGAVDYIQKPLKKESFLLRVKKALK